MSESVLVELQRITKSYPGQIALDDVSMQIQCGEVHALVGENGAGKSTLIRVLAGATQPDSGRIVVDGREDRLGGPAAARALGFAVVHQEPQIAPNQTVTENIFLGALPSRLGMFDRAAAVARARQVLEPFEVDIDPRRRMADYGAAARRVVEIARAVSQNARLLILDEPTAALPAAERESLLTLIREFASSGGSVLYVSHHLDEILDVSDTVTALRNGQRAGTRPRAEVTREVAIRMILGTSLEAGESRNRPTPGSVVLDVERLTTERGGSPHDLTVRSGEIVGLFGRIDAGHERLARAVAGATRPKSGGMCLRGKVYRPRSPHGARRQGVGFLPGERKTEAIFAHASVTENIVAGGAIGVVGGGFVRRNERHAVADRWRNQLDIKVPSVRRSIRTLSGGNQQKCLLARLLALNPALLVLEHPTFGVDLGARVEIYSTIYRATRDGLAVLVVSDDLDELQVLADRVVVFRNGAIQGALSGDDISSNRILELAL